MLIAFPLQQRLHERVSVFSCMYICMSCFVILLLHAAGCKYVTYVGLLFGCGYIHRDVLTFGGPNVGR